MGMSGGKGLAARGRGRKRGEPSSCVGTCGEAVTRSDASGIVPSRPNTCSVVSSSCRAEQAHEQMPTVAA